MTSIVCCECFSGISLLANLMAFGDKRFAILTEFDLNMVEIRLQSFSLHWS